MGIDGALGDVVVAGVGAIDELRAGEKTAGALDQGLQHGELGDGQGELLAAHAHFVALEVDLDGAVDDRPRSEPVAGLATRAGTPQYGLDPNRQLPGAEGLVT